MVRHRDAKYHHSVGPAGTVFDIPYVLVHIATCSWWGDGVCVCVCVSVCVCVWGGGGGLEEHDVFTVAEYRQ